MCIHLKLDIVNFKYVFSSKFCILFVVFSQAIYIYFLLLFFFLEVLQNRLGKFSDISLVLIPFKMTDATFNIT